MIEFTLFNGHFRMNNINQIAVHVNSTDNIYTVDFAGITKKLNYIWQSLRFLQS